MNRLKELRQEKKLSQKELAKELEVHFRTLQNWENEESQIKPDKAQELADYFGVSVGYLLGYEEYDKVLVPNNADDHMKAMNLAVTRISKILNLEAGNYFKNYLGKTTSAEDYKTKHNFVIALALLSEEYSEIVFRYSLLSEDKAEITRKLLEVLSAEALDRLE